ncbi:hypothetical protein WMY93_030894 [Mugilogobius chulae]|uniref:Sushi domain-containing protein n=1 Tax=Mugilogobius chulae TaxID=88201 RepID=A0AAW0MPR0_9GOBI
MKLTVTLLLFLWGFVDFTLTVQVCSQLPSVKHAFVLDEYIKAEYQTGDVIYFCCDPGYTTGLNTTYICTENGWSERIIGNCIEDNIPMLLACTPPPPVINGYLVRNSTLIYSNGQKAQYRCDHSHLMRGGPFKMCTNGQWTGDIQCHSICDVELLPNNIKFSPDNVSQFLEGESLKFQCINQTYMLQGASQATCLGNGQWNHPFPTCTAITCKLSSDPPEGTDYDNQGRNRFHPGESVRVVCGDKLWVKRTELQTAELTCDETGQWDFYPWSDVTKMELRMSTDGEGTDYDNQGRNRFHPGESVRVVCGDKLWVKRTELQTAELTCDETGQWDFYPVCQMVRCYKNGAENVYRWGGKFFTNAVNMDETLLYRCYQPYKETSERATCTRQGWEPNPLCKAIECPALTVNDKIVVNGFLDQPINGSAVQFSCRDPFDELVGPAQIVCDENGQWSSEPPLCRASLDCTLENFKQQTFFDENFDLTKVTSVNRFPVVILVMSSLQISHWSEEATLNLDPKFFTLVTKATKWSAEQTHVTVLLEAGTDIYQCVNVRTKLQEKKSNNKQYVC